MRARAILWLLIFTSASPAARADVVTSCCAQRLRVVGIHQRRVLDCHARATARGGAVDPACVARAAALLDRQLRMIEASHGCPGPGSSARVAADVDRIVGVITAAARPVARASTCAARKLKATGRLASSLASLYAAEAPYPPDHLGSLDPFQLPIGRRFTATLGTLDARPDCLTTNDATHLGRLVTIGAGVPGPAGPPDGMLLFSMRVCPKCSDLVQGGAEQCDGAFDRGACDGPCNPDCSCSICGDGVRNQSEACDGTDASDCTGLCRSDCTCPPAVCGNQVRELGEECDGAAPSACSAGCLPDCTCPPAVCGNGIVETGEQCDSTPTCAIDGIPIFSCSGTCQCCDGGLCGLVGCCDPREFCVSGPSGFGSCIPTIPCTTTSDCVTGHVCLPSPVPSPPNVCFGTLGARCPTVPLPGGGTYQFPCVAPAVCTGARCCLPSGESCISSPDCCSGTCNGGICN
jgi:hypothetical protein